MVGLEAEVASPCRPRGQVRILGELWEAMCEGGAEAGDLVRVTDVDGLRLVVERTESRMA
jgi:membrane-bound ClpP family serine protease